MKYVYMHYVCTYITKPWKPESISQSRLVMPILELYLQKQIINPLKYVSIFSSTFWAILNAFLIRYRASFLIVCRDQKLIDNKDILKCTLLSSALRLWFLLSFAHVSQSMQNSKMFIDFYRCMYYIWFIHTYIYEWIIYSERHEWRTDVDAVLPQTQWS